MKKRNKHMKNTITWVAIIIVVALAVILGLSYFKSGTIISLADDMSESDYQAVFLVNGQVYFGKLENEGSQFMTLTDVYYLQVNQQIQPAEEGAATTPDVSLVKLGGELHGPTDEMDINRDQVLLIEDLKTSSNVVRAIEEYKKSAAAAPVAPAAPATN
jgi:hypothetical protein